MKKTLVIGSTVVDVTLALPRLPGRGEDVNLTGSRQRIGGCAYNVAAALRLFGIPHILCSPVGTGVYGGLVAAHFARLGMEPFIRLEEENGCCYCLVEPDGERTFLSLHGAEYRFQKDWLQGLDLAQADSVFVCGIEMEEQAGEEIADFAAEHPELTLYFAPGPRAAFIPSGLLQRLFALGPVLHLNKREAQALTGEGDVEKAASRLRERTGNMTIITCGAGGAYCQSAEGGWFLPGLPVKAVDTTGAGDAHCGAVIACLKQGKSLKEAVAMANTIGARIAAGELPVPVGL